VAGAVGEGVTGLRVVASAAGDTATTEVFAGAGCEQAAMDNTRPKAASSAMRRPARPTRPDGVAAPADGPRTARCGPAPDGRR
jgi:hypothetical protein